MYIQYIRNQYQIEHVWAGYIASEPGIKCPLEDSKVPEFKPTWLVRVLDMQVVPGSSVSGNYWALSYSWNQSGELIHKGGDEYSRIDEGQHQIIEYQGTRISAMTDKNGEEYPVVEYDPETKSTLFVTFQGFIQQVCKDVGIDYVWFDQMCINQDNHEEKMREIKQMHRIYKNARCTLALVPELGCWPLKQGSNHENSSEWWGENANVHVLPNTEWCKRIWTLEEAYVSKSILFVGRNVHIWADVDYLWKILNPSNVVTAMAERTRKWMACTALWYSRNRTSSKQHDRIFALANIFPEIMDRITFSYKQPLLDLMVQFYGALAQKDISILFFGVPIDQGTDVKIAAARQREGSFLPSWTGARGAHLIQFFMDNELTTGAVEDYSITGACMRLTSRFVTVRIETANALEKPDDFANPNKYRSDGHHKYYTDEYGGHHSFSKEGIPLLPALSRECDGYAAESGCTDLVFVTIPSESYSVDTLSIHSAGLKVTHGLFLAVKDKVAINSLSKLTHYGGTLSLTDECSNCIILLDQAFQYQPRLPFQPTPSLAIYPVIKKDKGCYKSIGVCFLDRKLNIDPFVQTKQTFHIE